MTITIYASVCIVIVLIGAIHYAHSRRSLAERAVDAAYRMAFRASAFAAALDAALTEYRARKEKLLHGHTPFYAEP